jgi:hypothetical protein
MLHGMMDEQFLQGLADKVHRGQEGRVLKGLVAGGPCYGYKNVPIEDASKSPSCAGPAHLIRMDSTAIAGNPESPACPWRKAG